MSQVMVDDRALELCRSHAAMVAEAMPETFADLRALFVGVGIENTPTGRQERRSPIDRRRPAEPRLFSPGSEGRRSFGRRATDPRD
jgi:hypothetical protein